MLGANANVSACSVCSVEYSYVRWYKDKSCLCVCAITENILQHIYFARTLCLRAVFFVVVDDVW